MSADIDLDALEQALHERRLDLEDPLVHHSDRGVQYFSIRYTERLAELVLALFAVGDVYVSLCKKKRSRSI